jgi:hypothetical protein
LVMTLPQPLMEANGPPGFLQWSTHPWHLKHNTLVSASSMFVGATVAYCSSATDAWECQLSFTEASYREDVSSLTCQV